ncbi:MAG: ABC transporter ATP-binding protein [Patescibacteria group bacterium]
MMPETVITAENVTKDFILQEDETILAKIVGKVSGSKMPRRIRALDNVSFTLGRGEVLGIIGRNGSGKTTLLRVLSGIYPPTCGRVHVHGKLMPLINSTVGVQPKLTMRDNIYLISSLFGLSRSEISQKFNYIVEFSELEDFVDVRMYKFSNGMKARVAFSIAAHLDPEILLLDEVFMAGDARFKEKSRDRMMELVRGDATVVMASHSEGLLREVADRVIWLENGRVKMDGTPEDVIDAYLGKMNIQKGDEAEKENRDVPSPLRRQKEEQIVVS